MINEITNALYSKKPNQTLYHYTSLTGVKGIVDTGLLRTTDIRYFSDAAEMKHTVDRLSPNISFREGYGASNLHLLNQLREWLSHRLTSGHMLFVGCFTANGNLLSQWRSYCPTARGVSIGFDPGKLTICATEQGWRIGKCIYDSEEQEDIVRKILDVIEGIAEAQGENGDPSKRHPHNSFHDIFEAIETDLLFLAALLKHPAFHEEQEWRIVSPIVTNYVDTAIDYREGPSMLVPFINLRLPKAEEAPEIRTV